MSTAALEQAFADHRRLLWGLGYRMLGTAADADEVVQEAFEKALKRPPALDRPLRPWLVRVTVNAARDRLRRRKRAPYAGPWLPQPIEVDDPGAALEPSVPPARELERKQSVSYALLVALERLTPTQRAVWLLREVMDLSTAEAAEVLAVTPGSVKVTLHRARKALDGAGGAPRTDPMTGLAAVGQLAGAILAGDVAAVCALLDEDVVAVSDGGGIYHAARRPVVGALAVARLLIGLAKKTPNAGYRPAWVQGQPGVFVDTPDLGGDFAPRSLTLFSVVGGRVVRVWSVLAPGKLPAEESGM